MERYKCITGDDSLEEDDDGPYMLYADAQATVEALQKKYDDLLGKYRQLVDFYDKHHGTPCEQIRHQQQVEALQARVRELQGIADEKCRCFLERAEQSEKQLTQRTAEFQRHDGELQQICGQALGYPWFKDDQKNFPGATEKDGVCVGEHVGITIAQELANAYRKRTAELEAANKHCEIIEERKAEAYKEVEIQLLAKANLQAELERVRGLVKTYADAKIDFDDKRLQEDHYEWKERYRKLTDAEQALIATLPRERGARLRRALEQAGDEICSEFCGAGPCHKKCMAVKNALDGGKGVQGGK